MLLKVKLCKLLLVALRLHSLQGLGLDQLNEEDRGSELAA